MYGLVSPNVTCNKVSSIVVILCFNVLLNRKYITDIDIKTVYFIFL